MSEVSVSDGSAPEAATSVDEGTDDDQRVELLGAASTVLALLSFFTLIKLADQSERTPLRALGLFFATTTESVTAAALGASAVSQARQSDRLSRGLVLGAAGTVLGIITTLLNFNWMRTRRRV